jgi:hypothetical protein
MPGKLKRRVRGWVAALWPSYCTKRELWQEIEALEARVKQLAAEKG